MKSSDIERRERREHVGSIGAETFQSYRDRAFADMALEAHGRHAAAAKAEVIGKVRVPQYPAASGPWNDPVQVPDEPPLGYSVQDDIEPTGNYHEIQESLIAASVAIPSSDAASAREDVDATPPQRAAPSGGFVSPSDGAPSSNVADVPWGTDDAASLIVRANAAVSGAASLLRRGRKL
jgi:hypothetical protein